MDAPASFELTKAHIGSAVNLPKQSARTHRREMGRLGWGMTVTIESDVDAPPITTLTGTIDQAPLLGLLRWLYSLGLPLISIICLEVKQFGYIICL